MRQHVNPLSKYFEYLEPLPELKEIFRDPSLPLHLDIGCGSGKFLMELAIRNKSWNYLGIEIREKLVLNAKLRLKNEDINNLYFAYGNAEYLIKDWVLKISKNSLNSISFNFPDPWFKKKHHKRRIIKQELLLNLSQIMPIGSLLIIKSDVEELFNYMDSIIAKVIFYKKVQEKNSDIYQPFNPQRIKTEREIYALRNRLKVYERSYRKLI